MSSKKQERLQRHTEERIGQYKNVVSYLSGKKDVSEIPVANQACIVSVLVQGGWSTDGGFYVKGNLRLNLIEAGKIEFKKQYDQMAAEHLVQTVKSYSRS